MAVIFDNKQRQVCDGIEIGGFREPFFSYGMGAAAVGRKKLCIGVGVDPVVQHPAHRFKILGLPHIDGGAEQRVAFKMHMGIGKCRNNGQAVHVDLFAAGIGIRNTVSGEYNFIPVNNHDGKTAVFIVTGYKMPVGQNFHKKLPFLK